MTIDFAPFREAASLLYAGPWVAERYAAVGAFVDAHSDAVHPVVAQIIRAAAAKSAADAYRGLMDLAAIAMPAGFRRDGLPFGVSIIGQAFTDTALLALASRMAGTSAGTSGDAPGCIHLAVVGAHLSGQPLNSQLTDRGARLVTACRTSPEYRLFALPNTTPPKPALVRQPGFDGRGIALEIWAVPAQQFGGFVAAVPPFPGIGNVQLDTGERVKGFICEPAALDGATEITEFGGWIRYLLTTAG